MIEIIIDEQSKMQNLDNTFYKVQQAVETNIILSYGI